MDSIALKNALRKELIAQRRSIAPEAMKQNNLRIFEGWRNRFTLKSVRYFHIFQSISSFNEIDTQPFVNYAWSRHSHVRVVVPIVEKGKDDLLHVEMMPEQEMQTSSWGIPEPVPPWKHVFPMQMDMVLVPLLGFDMRGHRLGYGKGFYDRFLNLCRPKCLKIGLALEMGKQGKNLLTHSGDVPLDFIVTEAEIYRFC